MRKPFAALALGLTLIPASSAGYSGPIPPPVLKEGQFVYSLDDCAPAGLSRTQQASLNRQLRGLRHPFYVVVLCTLPTLSNAQIDYAHSNGFRGDSETLRIEVSTAMLMEDWASTSDRYDASNSGVFVISFDPRKYAWHPSLRARNELHLDRRGQDVYTERFVSAAKTRPADYGQGIIDLASAYDAWYFDQTDPDRIARRAEETRRREEERRLRAAQGRLDAEIHHLQGLLSLKDYLPSDVESFRDALKEAKKVRQANDPAQMLAAAETLKGSVAVLDHAVSEKKAAARAAMAAFLAKWGSILLLVLGVVYAIWKRRRAQRELQASWEGVEGRWRTELSNAMARWSEIYTEREDILGLFGVSGETKRLWDATTAQVDDILVRIHAMEDHVARCRTIYKRGHFFHFAPYREALSKIHAPFEFDTGRLNKDNLFGGETITKMVDPKTFAQETADLFRASQAGWEALEKAAAARLQNAREAFDHTGMDTLFDLCAAHGISERRLFSHPLFGDNDSDTQFYKSLEDLRQADPLLYLRRVQEAKDNEAAMVQEIKTIASLLQDVGKAKEKVNQSKFEGSSQVAASDDPTVTLAQARILEESIPGIVAESPLTLIQEHVARLKGLYDTALQQHHTIQIAVSTADAKIRSAVSAQKANAILLQAARRKLDAASKRYSRMKEGEAEYAAGQRYEAEGSRLLERAKKALQQGRHVEACRRAVEAETAMGRSQAHIRSSIEYCGVLEREEADFKRKVSDLEGLRQRLLTKMRETGRHAKPIPDYVPMAIADTVDYARLSASVDQQVHTWRRILRASEEALEAENRLAREAARRAQEQLEAARRAREASRRSSYSSGFGGGGFGGSGGGFGGGGFGGSGGGSGGGFGGGGFGGSSGSF